VGYVQIRNTKKDVRCRGVRLHYGGVERTWQDDHQNGEELKYFEGRQTLWGSERGSKSERVSSP
jgi:hypothetical protein